MNSRDIAKVEMAIDALSMAIYHLEDVDDYADCTHKLEALLELVRFRNNGVLKI